MNVVGSFRPYHESEGVGIPLAHLAGEPQICSFLLNVIRHGGFSGLDREG